MTVPGLSCPPGSYVEAMRSIDMTRLRRLADEVPGDPTRAVRSMVTASSDGAESRDLLVWEQSAVAQEYYLPPNDCYEIFIRLSAASPVVQWREGMFDLREGGVGQVVVAPPYRALYFRTFGPGRNLHLSVTPALLMRAAGFDQPNARVRLRSCFGEADEVIAGVGRVLLDYVKSPGTRSRAFLESASLALAIRLLERFGENGPTPRCRLSTQQMAGIDEFLKAQMDKPHSLATMAQLVDLSPQAFHRAFKATVGVPPLRYSLQMRMRRARDLVEGTTRPIGEIGAAVGFPDLAHFTNTFRKHWGVAPTRLRRG